VSRPLQNPGGITSCGAPKRKHNEAGHGSQSPMSQRWTAHVSMEIDRRRKGVFACGDSRNAMRGRTMGRAFVGWRRRKFRCQREKMGCSLNARNRPHIKLTGMLPATSLCGSSPKTHPRGKSSKNRRPNCCFPCADNKRRVHGYGCQKGELAQAAPSERQDGSVTTASRRALTFGQEWLSL